MTAGSHFGVFAKAVEATNRDVNQTREAISEALMQQVKLYESDDRAGYDRKHANMLAGSDHRVGL